MKTNSYWSHYIQRKESGLWFLLRSQGTSLSDESSIIPLMAHVLETARAAGSREGDVLAQAQLPV